VATHIPSQLSRSGLALSYPSDKCGTLLTLMELDNKFSNVSINMEYVEVTTLEHSDIIEAFLVTRGTSWSLEQTCYIVDRIPESLCM